MATITFEVTNYSFGCHPELAWNLDGRGVVHTSYILCRGDVEHELIIAFLAEGEASQPNYYDAAIKRTYLLRPASEYMRYIDLLRNEKPVFASINDESPAFTFLYTGQEPVGAGELTE